MSNEVDFLEGDFGFDEDSDRTLTSTQRELLTLKLLREAIQLQNPDDAVMRDFSEYVLPNLLRVAIGVTAKGGKFFDDLDRKNEAAGKVKVRRDNAADQSLNTHLLNGLFPANLIERRLAKLDTTIKRVVRDRERRLVIAGFILHDFEKFPDAPDDCRKLPLDAHRQIIDQKVHQLGLDRLIDPNDLTAYKAYVDDLLCMAYNAQRRWDTNWNFSEFGLNPTLKDRVLRSLSDLTCLADSLASIVKHPYDAENTRLNDLLHNLSDGQLQFTYHSISENRGVLTNVVNNALVEAHTSLNTDDRTYYEPLLYLPTGVIYLAQKGAPKIQRSGLSDRVVTNIINLCEKQLQDRKVGFSRGNIGMKYADYYNLFFDIQGLFLFAVDAVPSKIRTSKAADKSANLAQFKRKGTLPEHIDTSFSEDLRIDHLAELGALVTGKFWKEYLDKVKALLKKDKKLPPLPTLDLTAEAVQFLGLSEHTAVIKTLQQLKDTGGIAYDWYYIAAKYLEHNPGLENVREISQRLVNRWVKATEPIIRQYELPDEWNDLREWCDRVIMLPGETQEQSVTEYADIFLKELSNYNNAKKPRGRQLICSISHSAYTVTEQMESAVLFTPQVYTNKQTLGGSNAKRNISNISGIEMMLRQILMNQTQAVGKRFEDGKYRYLYFYPTYYFTPETNRFLQKAYSGIAQTRFDTSIRNHFISKDLDASFERDRYQTVDAFLIEADLEHRKNLDEADPEFKRDRTFKLAYPDDKPLTFYFMALPPGKDPTDTESWVMPAWLALAFPMILDVKTVVSESPIPPFNDGAEFEESVFLDSAPQALRMLMGNDRFRLDHILEGWKTADGIQRSAPLNTLTAAYAIHLDVNAKQGKGGYDANWGRLTELAKDLDTSPLYVFSYLAKWARNQSSDTPSPKKIRLYAHHFYPCFDPYVKFDANQTMLIVNRRSPLNHPQNLTELYRKFYRAKQRYNPKANAVLKPIDVAAEVLLKADTSIFQGEVLVMVVAAEIFKLMDRVRNSRAEGFTQIRDREEERQAILDFARYFVEDVFEKAFAGDRARLSGRQLNLIRDTCELLYRLEQDKDNRELKAKGELSEEEPGAGN
ncbi:MAG: type I-D CRISPR-associated protein Cas10d/Csc3 [Leptolyngbyaceae cyanobacterium CSU_1_3]|nr:type I-D CRISPR-associated protein Cas10d/Csc3 [Leptolyngbyaceae cyanobacterium CSU_1_3]